MSSYITPELFDFFRELSDNNEKPWFDENRPRFESEVREPLLQFIRDFEPHLKAISPHFTAIAKKSGGSLFRIFRDVRFSKDKRPYKTQAGVHFRHEQGKDAYTPGYYLHLEPGQVFMGAGIWHGPTSALNDIRAAMDKDPKGWKAVSQSKEVSEHFTLMRSDTLKRAPKGYPKDHPIVEDLKLKSFILTCQLSEEDAIDDDFMEVFVKRCQLAAPMMSFLTRALGQPF